MLAHDEQLQDELRALAAENARLNAHLALLELRSSESATAPPAPAAAEVETEPGHRRGARTNDRRSATVPGPAHRPSLTAVAEGSASAAPDAPADRAVRRRMSLRKQLRRASVSASTLEAAAVASATSAGSTDFGAHLRRTSMSAGKLDMLAIAASAATLTPAAVEKPVDWDAEMANVAFLFPRADTQNFRMPDFKGGPGGGPSLTTLQYADIYAARKEEYEL